ncbi:integrin beta-PS-like [Dendroctonus ponderosae]|uniref:integrin beta-PS n=1 Tax=Dendroctonus ponderosae TaxID=77166 RepID=UPI0020363472|nr:integrin beta-PS [Dendroctonus ponderosae]XP_048519098.1 integrin beta-PS-like [Dendroctonus ponderosae]
MKVLGTDFTIIVLFIVLKCSTAHDCESKETCEQCIQELECYWCSTPTSSNTHCLNKSDVSSCNASASENPEHSFVILKEKVLSEYQQISPQQVRLKLRKNEKYEINFQYKQSANYPVDLYYIMDLSNSMAPSKTNLAKLGAKLADEMMRKTNDFKIGFGSFVDKLTLPYVSSHPGALKNPCQSQTMKCEPPYNFRNQLSLVQNATLFTEKVQKTLISGNLDTPEGGLDAIMQAMVCKTEIGWRANARHLLVMSTDAVSHIAGDGKLGGVIEPNDATCHLEDNTYTKGLQYDYPSISQINYVARENNINIIFAIVLENLKSKDHLKNHYQEMSKIIENSKTGTLDKNSDNVVQFISDIYDQIRDAVRITSDAKKDVNVTITSNCTSFIDGGCSSVKPGEPIKFTAIIEPLVCYNNSKLNKKIIKIKPEGLEDHLQVELEVLCECACSLSRVPLDTSCSQQGDLECGICRCKEGRFGSNCQCDWTESKGEDPSQCIKPDGKNETCSGQGKCKCGKCECKSRPDKSELIYGKYCECDNFSCPQKCSGRGRCECGVCKCDNGWSGSSCDCSSDESQCMPPDRKFLCSGHGNCSCGSCICREKEGYNGKYCEKCTNCDSERCEKLRPCVECVVYKSGAYASSSTCSDHCDIFTTNIVKKLNDTKREGVNVCRVPVEDQCTVVFEYSYDENNMLFVTAEEKMTCRIIPDLFVYIISVIGTILLIGIITMIIWKVVTTFHDKKEYARFLNERDQTKWSAGENPLYKPGTSHFQNPVYGRASYRTSVANAEKKNEITKTEQ